MNFFASIRFAFRLNSTEMNIDGVLLRVPRNLSEFAKEYANSRFIECNKQVPINQYWSVVVNLSFSLDK